MVHTVLIVEDDDALRSLLTRMLKHSGFLTTAAVDGQQAIEMLSSRTARWDSIVLDLMMPRVDGFGVLDFLRKNQPAMVKRTVVATAFLRAASDPRLSDVCAVIEKPFKVSEVIETIGRCCKGDATRDARETSERPEVGE